MFLLKVFASRNANVSASASNWGGGCFVPGTRERSARKGACGFTLLETLVAMAIVAIGFLGLLGMVSHAGRLAAAAEEDALASSSLEQRMDQLRLLEWPELTSTGVIVNFWTARPTAMVGIPILRETLTISAYDVPTAKTLQATWITGSAPSAAFTGSGPELNKASAVKVVCTLSWTGRRSGRAQIRSVVTFISRGGISKSDPA